MIRSLSIVRLAAFGLTPANNLPPRYPCVGSGSRSCRTSPSRASTHCRGPERGSEDFGMNKRVLSVCLVLLAGSCATTQRHDGEGRFEIGIVGDLPYTAADEAKMPALIDDVNKADLAFVLHVGDMQADGAGYVSGALPCADATLSSRKAQIETIRHPVILTPGDNDWSDCHRAVPKGFDPSERLAKLREMFFQGNDSLGQRRLPLLRQSADPRYAKFRENARWEYGGGLFMTLPIVGDNNNLGRTPEQDAEYPQLLAPN